MQGDDAETSAPQQLQQPLPRRSLSCCYCSIVSLFTVAALFTAVITLIVISLTTLSLVNRDMETMLLRYVRETATRASFTVERRFLRVRQIADVAGDARADLMLNHFPNASLATAYFSPFVAELQTPIEFVSIHGVGYGLSAASVFRPDLFPFRPGYIVVQAVNASSPVGGIKYVCVNGSGGDDGSPGGGYTYFNYSFDQLEQPYAATFPFRRSWSAPYVSILGTSSVIPLGGPTSFLDGVFVLYYRASELDAFLSSLEFSVSGQVALFDVPTLALLGSNIRGINTTVVETNNAQQQLPTRRVATLWDVMGWDALHVKQSFVSVPTIEALLMNCSDVCDFVYDPSSAAPNVLRQVFANANRVSASADDASQLWYLLLRDVVVIRSVRIRDNLGLDLALVMLMPSSDFLNGIQVSLFTSLAASVGGMLGMVGVVCVLVWWFVAPLRTATYHVHRSLAILRGFSNSSSAGENPSRRDSIFSSSSSSNSNSSLSSHPVTIPARVRSHSRSPSCPAANAAPHKTICGSTVASAAIDLVWFPDEMMISGVLEMYPDDVDEDDDDTHRDDAGGTPSDESIVVTSTQPSRRECAAVSLESGSGHHQGGTGSPAIPVEIGGRAGRHEATKSVCGSCVTSILSALRPLEVTIIDRAVMKLRNESAVIRSFMATTKLGNGSLRAASSLAATAVQQTARNHTNPNQNMDDDVTAVQQYFSNKPSADGGASVQPSSRRAGAVVVVQCDVMGDNNGSDHNKGDATTTTTTTIPHRVAVVEDTSSIGDGDQQTQQMQLSPTLRKLSAASTWSVGPDIPLQIPLILQMDRAAISVVATNVSGFEHLRSSMLIGSLAALHGRLLQCLMQVAGDHSGTVVNFYGDRALIVFRCHGSGNNASSPCRLPSPQQAMSPCSKVTTACSAAAFMLRIRRRVADVLLVDAAGCSGAVGFHMAASTGEGCFGTMGSRNLSGFHVVSPSVTDACAMLRFCSRLSRPILLSAEMTLLMKKYYEFRSSASSPSTTFNYQRQHLHAVWLPTTRTQTNTTTSPPSSSPLPHPLQPSDRHEPVMYPLQVALALLPSSPDAQLLSTPVIISSDERGAKLLRAVRRHNANLEGELERLSTKEC